MLLCTREHHLAPLHGGGADGEGGGGGAAGGSGAGGSSGAKALLSPADLTTGALRGRTGSLRSSSLTSMASLAGGSGAVEDDADPYAATPATPAAAGAGSGTATPSAAAARPTTPQLPALGGIHSRFLPTARRIMQFADGRQPRPEDRVVYIAGGWDLFNVGHIEALKEARKHGDFLLVGIHDDATVHAMRGHGLPILNLYERTLSLLSCRYVDEVVIGAPWEITEDLVKTMNISLVVRGTVSDMQNEAGHEALGWSYHADTVASKRRHAYAVPERMGILRTFTSPSALTAVDVIHRIMASRAQFQRRYTAKAAKESEYYASVKTFVPEA
jgi:cytidyltransferase-like protein